MCRNGTDNPLSNYNYDSPNGQCEGGPTEWICILFLALFGVTTFVHLVQAVRYRQWFFIPTMVTGGLGELTGWSGRLWSSQNPQASKPFIIQIITTIFSPSFMSAANFIVLGRMIAYLNAQQYSRLSPRKFTWIFLTFDIVCLFVQSAGGGIASSDDVNQARIGTDIALGGIALQTAAIALYTIVAGEFVWRLSRNKPLRARKPLSSEPEEVELTSPSFEREGRWGGEALATYTEIPTYVRLVFVGLGVSTLFLLIRAIYRLVEFADGWGGRIQSTEAYFNVLDGGCIIVAMAAINVLHPGRLLPKHASQ